MGYTIKVLKSEEFDELPYSRVRSALGLYDPESNEVYVRHTKINELNKYVLSHELDHIVEETPTDEIDGIRYKITDSLFSGLGNIGGMISKGLGSAGSALSSGYNSSIGNVFSKAGQSVPSQLNPQQLSYQNNLNKGSTGGFLNTIGSFLNPTTGSGLKNLLGIGALGIGLNKNYPTVPQLPQSSENFRNQTNSGGTPLGILGKSNLENLNQHPFQVPPEMLEPVLHPLRLKQQEERKRLQDLYRNLRPGSDPLNDSSFSQELSNLDYKQGQELAEATSRITNESQAQRYQYAQGAIGSSEQQLADLQKISQMDIEQIMNQYKVDYQKAFDIKQALVGVGTSLLTPPNPLEALLAKSLHK